MYTCLHCNRKFESHRGLTVHMNKCLTSGTSYLRRSKRAKKQREIFTFQTDETQDISINFTNHNFSQKSSKKNDQLQERSIVKHDLIHSSSNNFINQEEKYQIAQPNHAPITKHMLAEIDLLKIVNDLGCPINAYDNIMQWADKWNTDGLSFSNQDASNSFKKRSAVLKKLSHRYDLDHTLPFQKTIELVNDQNTNIGQPLTIDVSCFDFRQQVLSLLRDKNLMHPNNLVGIDNDLSRNNEFIMEIIDSEWYENANKYYIKKYGDDKSRIICGIIFAIDKTHTDSKGKLCLEAVNFTLSIFKTKVRRNNPRAWRCLGFINDLNSIYGSGIKNSEKQSKKVSILYDT